MYWDKDRFDYDDIYESKELYYHDYVFPDIYISFTGKIIFTQDQINLLKDIVEDAIISNIQNVDTDDINEDSIKDVDFGIDYTEDNLTDFYYSSSILVKALGNYDEYTNDWCSPNEDIEFNSANYQTMIKNDINRLSQNGKLPEDLTIEFIESLYIGNTSWEPDN